MDPWSMQMLYAKIIFIALNTHRDLHFTLSAFLGAPMLAGVNVGKSVSSWISINKHHHGNDQINILHCRRLRPLCSH